MLDARRKRQTFQVLGWLCDAVVMVWLMLWIISWFAPDFVDVSNKSALPWMVPAVVGARLFGWLSREKRTA